MTGVPQLVLDDPWLEPQTEAIRHRITRYQQTLAAIERDHGSLSAYALGHKFTGIHYHAKDRQWIIREWAPQAKAVCLTGDFNNWSRDSHPLAPTQGGVWQLRLPADTLRHGERVKLHVIGADGSHRDRIPACIQRVVQDPVTHDFSGQIWHPGKAYVWRNDFDPRNIGAPLIYEAHVGMSGEDPRVHTYREFTANVLPRIAAAGYNTIQLMAVQEHPYYGSFGYHVSSFFAPSSRFGTPEDLKCLIDSAHGMGIAVLLDVVHSHAVKNIAEGLNDFDGSGNQYFHAGGKGDHPQWDSKCFDYGRGEVRQFLLSNVRYWLDEFHFDGFRFDGVTSMLYHSHGVRAFDSYADYFGEDVDQDAVLFLQLASTLAQRIRPGAIMVAEDMSGMPGLCRPVADGGCGFTHRLAMGIPDHWIKLLKHQRDEDWDLTEIWSVLGNRRQGEATIAYAESHDQALVGDKTLAFWLMDQEMYWHMRQDDPHPVIERGIALHKLIRLITFFTGGEGWLNFMGNEFGHPEWVDFPRQGNDWAFDHCRRQWSLVDHPELKYRWLGGFDRAMLRLEKDHEFLGEGFAEMANFDAHNKVLAITRGRLLLVINFSIDHSIAHYEITLPHAKPGTRFHLALDSDAPAFGGHDRLDMSIDYPVDAEHKLRIYTPARTAQVYTMR